MDVKYKLNYDMLPFDLTEHLWHKWAKCYLVIIQDLNNEQAIGEECLFAFGVICAIIFNYRGDRHEIFICMA